MILMLKYKKTYRNICPVSWGYPGDLKVIGLASDEMAKSWGPTFLLNPETLKESSMALGNWPLKQPTSQHRFNQKTYIEI